MPAAGTRSGSSDERAWRVPDSLRSTLAERYGPVFSGNEAEQRLRHLGPFSACGDRVTELAVKLGNLPLVGVVDLKTKRHEKIDPAVFAPLAQRRHLKVRNPPGLLTEGLRRAVRELVESGGGLIEVEGEEDLASLALVESMPAGTTVIYGIPGEGVSFVAVDAVSKGHVQALIRQMEIVRREGGA
jgi:GTP-dependent dephospho-CoA kinase